MGVFDVEGLKLPKITTYRGWSIRVEGKYVYAKPPSSHREQWPFGFGISKISQPAGRNPMGITARIDKLIRSYETPKFAPTLAKGEKVPAGYERDVAGRKAPRYPYSARSTRTRSPRQLGTERSRFHAVTQVRKATRPSSVQRTWRKR